MAENQAAKTAQHDAQINELFRRIADLEEDMYGNGHLGVKADVIALREEARKAHAKAGVDQRHELKWIAMFTAVLAAAISGGFRIIEVLLTNH